MQLCGYHCITSSVEAYLLWKCCCYVTWIAWDILFVMSSVTGNLCNKCPKQLVKQNSSYSDDFNAISGFTSNSRASGGPVTLKVIVNAIIFRKFLIISGLLHAVTIKILTAVKPLLVKNKKKVSLNQFSERKKERNIRYGYVKSLFMNLLLCCFCLKSFW